MKDYELAGLAWDIVNMPMLNLNFNGYTEQETVDKLKAGTHDWYILVGGGLKFMVVETIDQ
jgi:hypothetical protein